jgi:putative endonuclease
MFNAPPSWVYILANRPRGPLYVGVTADLVARVSQHRAGEGGRHSSRYRIIKLVYFEEHSSIVEAIRREKRLKRWRRAWKPDLIESFNPTWKDLWYELVEDPMLDTLRFPFRVGDEEIVVKGRPAIIEDGGKARRSPGPGSPALRACGRDDGG